MLTRIREGLEWRWFLATRTRFLRKTFRNGDELVKSYLSKTPCDEAICRDGTVIRHAPGRTGLAGMILEVWFEEVYTGTFYTPRVGDTIVDAGANIGLFSLLVARRYPGARVLSFEPFEENYTLLNENVRSARTSAVQTFRHALSGKRGVSVMIDGGDRSQDHRLTSPAVPEGDSRAVPTCTLADVLAMSEVDSLALFKCDIEGSEFDLFTEAADRDLHRVHRYAIEYHDNLRPGTLALLRERLGPSHVLVEKPSREGGYGMLYATRKSVSAGI